MFHRIQGQKSQLRLMRDWSWKCNLQWPRPSHLPWSGILWPLAYPSLKFASHFPFSVEYIFHFAVVRPILVIFKLYLQPLGLCYFETKILSLPTVVSIPVPSCEYRSVLTQPESAVSPCSNQQWVGQRDSNSPRASSQLVRAQYMGRKFFFWYRFYFF